MSESSFSLFELNNQIKKAIHGTFADTYWVIAEISEIREVRNGHCYIELIEKDEKTEQIIAKSRANIWAYTYRLLKPFFLQSTGQNLESGLKVLVRVSIDFQEVYGFSLNVRDIDPSYTLGDMAQKKQAILNKLSEDGVINMNKELDLPLVPQKIAVISSPTAAGYEDFCNQLNNNSYNYKYYIKLFPAIMQGDQTEESVIAALDKIYEYEDIFDVVVIIRGGGSSSDLMCFDNYWIAYNIAQFPLPVFSGIGHERDETVIDHVAHTRLKTPTAVAEYLIELVSDFDTELLNIKESIVNLSRDIIGDSRLLFERVSNRFKPLVSHAVSLENSKLNELALQVSHASTRYVSLNQNNLASISQSIKNKLGNKLQIKQGFLDSIPQRLKLASSFYTKDQANQLNLIEKTNNLLNPENILKKGYSITTLNGKAIKNVKEVKQGDIITTQFANGETNSKVID